MSQIPFNERERIQGLQRFGYSEAESRFLCMAALHSGYFLSRQYAQSLPDSGSCVEALIERLFDHGHAVAAAYERNIHLYRLCARPFYAAIGQEDNRNRRVRECSTIKNKLMALDFVLSHSDARFLAAEHEKTKYFIETLGIPESSLPTRVYSSGQGSSTKRFFVEKYPIFVPAEAGSSEPVSFCFIDEGLTTASHFETFLEHYGLLFQALDAFRLVYVAARPSPFRWAENVLQRHLHRLETAVPPEPVFRRLIDFFALRRQYEAKDFESLDRAKLLQLRNGQREFSQPKYTQLYERWKADGHAGVRDFVQGQSRARIAPNVIFSTHLLKNNYDFFGSLTAI